MSNFGLKLVNLNEVKVTLNAYAIENLFCYQSEMIGNMVAYYISQGMKNTLGLLGSADLIGNPTNLIRNIGSGFSDLANKPKEGFSKGII